MWKIVAILFIGYSLGVITGVFIDKDTVYKGVFRIKQRGSGNVQSMDIKPEIEPKTHERDRKSSRLARRELRKARKKL